jgi:hypothetical protein
VTARELIVCCTRCVTLWTIRMAPDAVPSVEWQWFGACRAGCTDRPVLLEAVGVRVTHDDAREC